MAETSYPPTTTVTQAQQPVAARKMDPTSPPPATAAHQADEQVLRLRGGCPGRLCGLPILPCRWAASARCDGSLATLSVCVCTYAERDWNGVLDPARVMSVLLLVASGPEITP
ncbi:uncharacterized protein LOC62_01G000197 [Vanrija pseudolonga]|uniref:Uncharacterized protein n=1 Tax=Vanrija pseudolonga TaxID=143232 RepID=A0AAF0XZ63_9TREE|nr:hypothetical protein LOC62_01G000197 [Vanrija pseudolonga]